MNHSLSKTTPKQLSNIGLVSQFAVTHPSEVQSSGFFNWEPRLSSQWQTSWWYALKPFYQVSLTLTQVLSLKSAFSPHAPSPYCWTTVRCNILLSIYLTPLHDLKALNDANVTGTATIFALLHHATKENQTRQLASQDKPKLTFYRRQLHENQVPFCDVAFRHLVLWRFFATILWSHHLRYTSVI